jgi:integrase
MSATEPGYCPISTLHRKLRQGTGIRGRARATVTRRLCTIAGFYKYTVEEELLEHSPAAHVGRPRVDYESHAAALDRNELGALPVAAGLGPLTEHALISLLALNGLRVSEANGADIEDLGLEHGHRTLTITRKGGEVATICSRRALPGLSTWASGERTGAPVFLAADGAAAGPARHLHRRRLRRRRRPQTGVPAGKLRPTISTVGRSCLRPLMPEPGGDAPRSQRERKPPFWAALRTSWEAV